MAEPFDSQVPSAEQPGSIRVIARSATNIAAFVGRTLNGAGHEPVTSASFADFRKGFGGLWQPATMSYAVEQFFENGGRCAVIVRVVNGARPPTLTLPTASGKLILRGVGAGSREFLRASVDYDAIESRETDRFNLVVQRVRTAGSEQIEEQEIFRRLTVTPGADRFIADALLDSRLVRVQAACARAAARYPGRGHRRVIGYTPSHQTARMGARSPLRRHRPAAARTGIFRAAAATHTPFVLPPLHARSRRCLSDALVAVVCRERRAMLSSTRRLRGPHAAHSEHASLAISQRRRSCFFFFFPRVVAFERLAVRFEMSRRVESAAGMIARGDETCPGGRPPRRDRSCAPDAPLVEHTERRSGAGW